MLDHRDSGGLEVCLLRRGVYRISHVFGLFTFYVFKTQRLLSADLIVFQIMFKKEHIIIFQN